MQYVEYRLVDGQLERSVREALDGAAPEDPRVMLRGIESATIGYHYRGQWLDGWPGGANAMPDAVRLELQLAGLGRIEQLFLLPGTRSEEHTSELPSLMSRSYAGLFMQKKHT